ncbi:MAG: hypothetical protein C4308_03660 [Chitinophagaceae bacterium]
MKLFCSEYASWHGTDLFLEKFKGNRQPIGRYFTYADNENEVFYSADETPVILGTMTFDEKNGHQSILIKGI